MNGVRDPNPFKRLITALEPWLDQVVIIGGWAHQLYRLHPHAQHLDYITGQANSYPPYHVEGSRQSLGSRSPFETSAAIERGTR